MASTWRDDGRPPVAVRIRRRSRHRPLPVVVVDRRRRRGRCHSSLAWSGRRPPRPGVQPRCRRTYLPAACRRCVPLQTGRCRQISCRYRVSPSSQRCSILGRSQILIKFQNYQYYVLSRGSIARFYQITLSQEMLKNLNFL